ncbi:hypothetical protein [Spirosoma aerolatum]|uniref:hypothetical protein n=1 Tax=Spirosoma aerolatum TaxID=1211326 RepID=UPI0009AD5858|nr:hypothetical protein [Spirosoma aerolatum]
MNKKGFVFNSYLASQLTGKSGGMLNATGTYKETDGAQIGTFNNQPVYAKIVNGHLAAYTYDTTGGPLVFKPGHWLLRAEILTASEAGNFSQTDPATGIYYAPDVSGFTGSTLGKALSGGSTVTNTGGGSTNTGGGSTSTGGGSLITNLLGGSSTSTGTPQTTAQKNTNILVVVAIIAAVGFAVYYFAKKR